MTTPDAQSLAHPTTVRSPIRAHRQHNPATPAELPNTAAIPHQPPAPAEIGSHPPCPTPHAPTEDACPPPPGTIPPGVDPDNWERNLRRVLEGMPRTINPASARILADLLTDDRTPADKPTLRGLE